MPFFCDAFCSRMSGPDVDIVTAAVGKADPAEMGTLRDLMSHLSVCVVSKKSKNTEVLHIAAEVSDILARIFSHVFPRLTGRLLLNGCGCSGRPFHEKRLCRPTSCRDDECTPCKVLLIFTSHQSRQQ